MSLSEEPKCSALTNTAWRSAASLESFPKTEGCLKIPLAHLERFQSILNIHMGSALLGVHILLDGEKTESGLLPLVSLQGSQTDTHQPGLKCERNMAADGTPKSLT